MESLGTQKWIKEKALDLLKLAFRGGERDLDNEPINKQILSPSDCAVMKIKAGQGGVE